MPLTRAVQCERTETANLTINRAVTTNRPAHTTIIFLICIYYSHKDEAEERLFVIEQKLAPGRV